MTDPPPPPETPSSVTGTEIARPRETSSGGLVRAAGTNSLGNIASRLLGLVRESVVAGTFGASGATSAFDAVSGVPKMVYELLIGGMLSAALVPVLSEYASDDSERSRQELDHVVSILLSLAGVILVAVVIIMELAAPWIAPLLVGGLDAAHLATATTLTRLIVPSVLIYGLSGILQAYHYARQRFVYPAAGAPAHNLGVIVTVILLARRLDIASLSIGVLVASVAQLIVQLPGLRGTHLRLRLQWRHPVVRRILTLYAPVVLSIIVQNVGIIIDRNLASRTVPEAITWMTKATFLIQLPLGLVSMAISLAVLPTLSQIDAAREVERFKGVFSRGLRLVLVVILPATAGLLSLGPQIIALLYQRGAFTAIDSGQTWRALQLYLIGLPFAAIDLPLIFAFYAQKDTVTPVVVGILAVLIYLAVGPALAFVAGWGYRGLVLANSVQLTGHAIVMLFLFARRFGGLGGSGLLRTSAKALAGSVAVFLVSSGARLWLQSALPVGSMGTLTLLAVTIPLAGLVYLLCARTLRLEELDMLRQALERRLGT